MSFECLVAALHLAFKSFIVGNPVVSISSFPRVIDPCTVLVMTSIRMRFFHVSLTQDFIAKLSFAICLQTGEGSRLLLHSSRVLRNSLGDILVSIQAHQHHLALTCIIHLSGHLDQHNIIRQLVSPGFTQNQMIESKLYLTLIRIARSEGPQAIRLGRTIVVILDRISNAMGAATAVTAVQMNVKMSKLKQPPALKKCEET